MVLQELNKPFQGKSTQNCFKISVSLFTWRIHCNQCHQPNLALNIAPCFPLLKLIKKKIKFSLFSAYISYKRETIKRKAMLNFTYVQFLFSFHVFFQKQKHLLMQPVNRICLCIFVQLFTLSRKPRAGLGMDVLEGEWGGLMGFCLFYI